LPDISIALARVASHPRDDSASLLVYPAGPEYLSRR